MIILTLGEQIKKMRRNILNDVEIDKYDDDFKDFLESAKTIFLNSVYPFDKNIDEIPARYYDWQVRCAIELYNLKEDGNYVSYSENALSWTRLKEGLSQDLLNELPPPQAGVPV